MKTKKIGDTRTDSQLVHDFVANNDNKAFTALIDRYRNKIYNQIFYTVRNEELANDLFQDTCIKVLLMLRDGKYNEEGKFQAWLLRLTANIVMDHFRKNQSNAEMPLSVDNICGDVLNKIEYSEPSTEHAMIEQQVKDTAVQLMNSLPDTQREILEMRFYQDLSFKEIAEQKGMSINTALGRMHYAVNNMRKLARKHAVALSA